MAPRIDLTGQRFGRLTALEFRPVKRGAKTVVFWRCACDCGAEKEVRADHLKDGRSRSCGCLNVEQARERFSTHGKSSSSIYSRYRHMLRRCKDPRCPEFKWYGGSGVTVCARWDPDQGGSFENFYADMGDPPADGQRWELDKDIKIPGNKVYGPEGCSWVTPLENSTGLRSNRLLTFQGRTQCVAEWAREYSIGSATLRRRIDVSGWSLERALTTPVRGAKEVAA